MTLINLIPAEVHHAALRRHRLIGWAVVVACSSVLAAIPYSLSIAREQKDANLREEVDALDLQAASLRAQLRLATGQAQQMHSDLDRSQALRSKRAWSGMFALIASSLPVDCWLQSVATDPESPGQSVARPPVDPNPTGQSPAPETITIEAPRKLVLVGYSTNDSLPLVFVSNLRQSEAFAQVALRKAMRAPSGTEASEAVLYQFEILCEW